MNKVTESDSHYDSLEHMSIKELLQNINNEDEKVALIVKKEIPKISKLIEAVFNKLNSGGRLFYLGAGTSGRLGILDASECSPTFGVSHDLVIGLIAGGDTAIRKAVEFAEDNEDLGWEDLKKYNISSQDIVIGIAASGTTPYVVGALKRCQQNRITTGCITCNLDTPLSTFSDYSVEVVVGPEFITGSTRMKSGTAQKLVLNMITTSTMIKLGKVLGNKMVDMQLSNTKLVERGIKMIMRKTNLNSDEAKKLLIKHGSVRKAIANKNG
tara:strand:- start:1975 stop:2781 length:807 start_codon:yes stop_codon:yes gene_type:complete